MMLATHFGLLATLVHIVTKDFHTQILASDVPLHPGHDLVNEILDLRPDFSTAANTIEGIPTLPYSSTGSSLSQNESSALGIVSCGGNVIARVNEVDTLFSPGYPVSYPSNLHCVWTIKPPPGFKVIGQFTEFDLTNSDNCESDYVQVSGGFDGSKHEAGVGRHCGKTAPKEFIQPDGASELKLVFHTNQGDACKGFAFQYKVETSHVTCGGLSSSSEFEFTNTEFPESVANDSQHCTAQVSHDCEKPICQLRLDLMDFELASPTAGNCDHDQFIVRANEPLPILCGRNSGQHIYVDVRGRKMTDLTIITDVLKAKPIGVFDLETNSLKTEWKPELDQPRKWRIKVTQIPCDCRDTEDPKVDLAPPGCLQYHSGISGKIQAFNFDGYIRNYEPCYNGNGTNDPFCGDIYHTGHLNDLDYAICFKDAEGYCGISFSAENSWDFQMNGIMDFKNELDWEEVPPSFGEQHCHEDYVFIPRGHHPEDFLNQYSSERYCGLRLGNHVPGPVISNSRPFLVKVRTDGAEHYSGVALANRGFNLAYKQIPCSLSTMDMISFA